MDKDDLLKRYKEALEKISVKSFIGYEDAEEVVYELQKIADDALEEE